MHDESSVGNLDPVLIEKNPLFHHILPPSRSHLSMVDRMHTVNATLDATEMPELIALQAAKPICRMKGVDSLPRYSAIRAPAGRPAVPALRRRVRTARRGS